MAGGTYVVIRPLAQGGFGITYQCIDDKLKAPVVVKEFFPLGCARSNASVVPASGWSRDSFAEGRQRFLEEARTLARFDHPGIVRVFGAFEENDTAYFVMEYLRGHTLSELMEVRAAPFDEASAVATLLHVCSALSAVHESGLLHRDIKPSNVMVTDEGRTVLIDFGTAREYASELSQSHTTTLTAGYAPLEQYSRHGTRRPSTDVYALAATGWHLLTGSAPPAATDRAVGVQLPSLQALHPSLTPRVAAALERGLSMDPMQRQQSVEEFVVTLDAPSPDLSRTSPVAPAPFTAQATPPTALAAPRPAPAIQSQTAPPANLHQAIVAVILLIAILTGALFLWPSPKGVNTTQNQAPPSPTLSSESPPPTAITPDPPVPVQGGTIRDWNPSSRTFVLTSGGDRWELTWREGSDGQATTVLGNPRDGAEALVWYRHEGVRLVATKIQVPEVASATQAEPTPWIAPEDTPQPESTPWIAPEAEHEVAAQVIPVSGTWRGQYSYFRDRSLIDVFEIVIVDNGDEITAVYSVRNLRSNHGAVERMVGSRKSASQIRFVGTGFLQVTDWSLDILDLTFDGNGHFSGTISDQNGSSGVGNVDGTRVENP